MIFQNRLWYSKTDCQISQTYCEFQKLIGNTQTNKNYCPVFTQTGRKCGNLPSRSIVYWISDSRINCLFICQSLSKSQQLIIKLQLDVYWIKTMLNQKKQCSAQLSLANRNCSFQKIDQLDWNHKPICEISKVCVNLIPNHNPES